MATLKVLNDMDIECLLRFIAFLLYNQILSNQGHSHVFIIHS